MTAYLSQCSNWFSLLVCMLILSVSPSTVIAQEESLKFGMSTALTGSSAKLGINMSHGVLLAFDQVNRAGGIRGKRLQLIVLDDGYEPSRTTPNMHKLIDEDKVLAVIGNVGTPTAVVSIPIIMEREVPFFGAFSGASILRKDPPDRYVVNYRASYEEEMAAIVDALIDHAGLTPEDFAFFTQRDAYGDAGFNGGIEALKRRGLKSVSSVVHARYERNTTTIEGALADMLESKRPIKAVIMVGVYQPCAKFITMARQTGLSDVYFMNISFVGTESLIESLNGQGENVYITQVVPPLTSGEPIVKEYLQAVARNPDEKPSLGSLEGYIAAKIFALAVQKIPGEVNRKSIIDSLEHLGEFDLGLGVPLNLSATSHQASHSIWPSEIKDGQAVLFDWKEFKKEK